MIAVTVRLFVVATLVAPMSALAAQQVTSPRPGGGPPNLPPHVQAQLWPTRELSPAEQELKTHVTALTDSLTRIDATGTLIERNFRSGASVAMARSAARSLTIDCARAARTAQPAVAFAATLSTSDPKWGEPAVRAWRAGLGELVRQLGSCEQAAQAQVAGGTEPSHDQLAAIAARVGQALVDYRRSEQGLLRTLKIDMDPVKKSR